MRSHVIYRNWKQFTHYLVVLGATVCISSAAIAEEEPEYTTDFPVEDCRFGTRGLSPYFVLLPGFRAEYIGEEDGEVVELVRTVLRHTRRIYIPGIGRVRTRVLEERETADGELVEISRNYFAICRRTKDIYYFGEAVDIYEDGEIVSHDGAWLAGVDDAQPGIIMPATFLLGSRYFQEIAPGVAMDRAEHTSMSLTIETPAGVFEDCVGVRETSSLDPEDLSYKIYTPGIGLIVDDFLELVDFGFVELDNDDD